MTIPSVSNFPTSIDSDDNLFLVHDSLRVKLSQDYNPGDTSIAVYGDTTIIARFPPTGIITLTEQCEDAENRAISFYYGSRTEISFDQLEILSGFTDVAKPKDITNITQNVMAQHHNAIKNALISIQQTAGKKGQVAQFPLTGTMEERINYLRSIALVPKAWFTADKTIGLIPFECQFRDLSFRLGTDGTTGVISYVWDFGDNTSSVISSISNISNISTISTISTFEGPISQDNVFVEDLDGGTITKVYTRPGIYDVTLTVTNDFGTDTVVFPSFINARVAAPELAVINFNVRAGQSLIVNGIPSGGPYTTTPVLRTPINTFVDAEIPAGINPNTGRTYAGEELSGIDPIDPITSYTWSLADDLAHSNSSSVRGSYSVGGIYNLHLRCDTAYGSYRITTYDNAIDVVEKYNLWLWNYVDTSNLKSYEFGIISETFKTTYSTAVTIFRNDSFLDGVNNETQQKKEFERNVGFSPRGTTPSGNGGVGLLYYASGRNSVDSPTLETIKFHEFNGFTQTYLVQTPISRPWNWIDLFNSSAIYFILGNITTAQLPNTSLTNQQKDKLNLNDLSVTSDTFTTANYKNGAQELKNNEVTFTSGLPNQGHMSVYRSCWKDTAGFILRNQGVGTFFRIKSFYKTSGTTSEYFQDIKKLTDMAGPAKIEGQLVPLSQGVYFFNNSGAISAFNPTTNIWETGGTGVNSASFRLLQDNTVVGFDEQDQTLVAASDSNKIAYLSFDYSTKAFIKFNETTLTFTNVSYRPTGTQFKMSIF